MIGKQNNKENNSKNINTRRKSMNICEVYPQKIVKFKDNNKAIILTKIYYSFKQNIIRTYLYRNEAK